MPSSKVAKRSASTSLSRQLTAQSSMSSYNDEGVPLSVGGTPEYLQLSPQVKNVLSRQISAAVDDVLTA